MRRIKNPQKRGFKFEDFLHKLFLENNMDPRGSFKIIGEQIDGSFMFQNEVYLLEAKWTKKPVDKSALVNFNSKVLSKSGFTRGLFISYSGYCNEALNTFSNGRNVKIILMTVRELAISFEREINFKDTLYKKIRALAEEGEYYMDIMDL
ncbi:MAG: restriction endonuclease [Nanoarchaeota archaeon]